MRDVVRWCCVVAVACSVLVSLMFQSSWFSFGWLIVALLFCASFLKKDSDINDQIVLTIFIWLAIGILFGSQKWIKESYPTANNPFGVMLLGVWILFFMIGASVNESKNENLNEEEIQENDENDRQE